MNPQDATTTSLLEGLRDSEDAEAWSLFESRVRPIVFGIARRVQLDSHLAADVAQETLMSVVELYRQGRYQRERGRLGAWVSGIARNRVRTALRSRQKVPRQADTADLSSLESEDEFAALWEQESRNSLLRAAFSRLTSETKIRQDTLDMFTAVFVEKRPANEVAEEWSVTSNAVHMAKYHCLGKLREIVRELEPSWELH